VKRSRTFSNSNSRWYCWISAFLGSVRMLELMYNLPTQRKLRDFLVTVEMVRSREINWNLLEKAG